MGGEDNPNPLDKHVMGMAKFAGGAPDAPVAPWLFAHAGREHSKRSFISQPLLLSVYGD